METAGARHNESNECDIPRKGDLSSTLTACENSAWSRFRDELAHSKALDDAIGIDSSRDVGDIVIDIACDAGPHEGVCMVVILQAVKLDRTGYARI